MHTMFKYVVLLYAEEISLSLFEEPFYLKNVLYVPFSVCLVEFVNCSNKITFYIIYFCTKI